MKTPTLTSYFILLCFFFIALEATSSGISSDQENEKKVETSLIQKKITIKGTGQTTGHIATLSIQNTSDRIVNINPQIMYIPSRGGHQPYVGRIAPGGAIPPGETIEMPVFGYCTDVHKPPVENGSQMPPIESWITVKDPRVDPSTLDGINIVPGPEKDSFSLNDIANIVASSAFNEEEIDLDNGIRVTWPGSDIVINGSISLTNNEALFAPMIIDAVMRIEKTAYEIVASGGVNTPFSNDSKREAEALIQQTIWMFMGAVTGEEYDKEDFSGQLIEQYENNTNTKIEDASAETVDRLEAGVDDFWSSFELVGVEAKVFSVDEALPSGMKEDVEKGIGKVDTSNVKAVGNAAEAIKSGSNDATELGGKVAIGSKTDLQPGDDEVIHVHGPAEVVGEKGSAKAAEIGTAGQQVGSTEIDYNAINKKEEFDNKDRKTYEDYAKERKHGMTHIDACRKLGIDPKSPFGNALRRINSRN